MRKYSSFAIILMAVWGAAGVAKAETEAKEPPRHPILHYFAAEAAKLKPSAEFRKLVDGGLRFASDKKEIAAFLSGKEPLIRNFELSASYDTLAVNLGGNPLLLIRFGERPHSLVVNGEEITYDPTRPLFPQILEGAAKPGTKKNAFSWLLPSAFAETRDKHPKSELLNLLASVMATEMNVFGRSMLPKVYSLDKPLFKYLPFSGAVESACSASGENRREMELKYMMDGREVKVPVTAVGTVAEDGLESVRIYPRGNVAPEKVIAKASVDFKGVDGEFFGSLRERYPANSWEAAVLRGAQSDATSQEQRNLDWIVNQYEVCTKNRRLAKYVSECEEYMLPMIQYGGDFRTKFTRGLCVARVCRLERAVTLQREEFNPVAGTEPYREALAKADAALAAAKNKMDGAEADIARIFNKDPRVTYTSAFKDFAKVLAEFPNSFSGSDVEALRKHHREAEKRSKELDVAKAARNLLDQNYHEQSALEGIASEMLALRACCGNTPCKEAYFKEGDMNLVPTPPGAADAKGGK